MGQSTSRGSGTGKGRGGSHGAGASARNGRVEKTAPGAEAHLAPQTPEPQPSPGVNDARVDGDDPGIERSEDTAQVLVATAGALLVGVLYLVLPDQFSLGPRWLLLVIESLLLAPVVVAAALERVRLPFRVARGLAISLLIVLTASLVGSVALLVAHITHISNGANLLPPAALLWVINVLVWSVWYWEMDGDGPRERMRHGHAAADFLFPQQQNGNPTGWAPGFIDYLFVAFCFATALSPADISPLSRRGKAMMMAEAVLSLTIIVVLVARAINIIPTVG